MSQTKTAGTTSTRSQPKAALDICALALPKLSPRSKRDSGALLNQRWTMALDEHGQPSKSDKARYLISARITDDDLRVIDRHSATDNRLYFPPRQHRQKIGGLIFERPPVQAYHGLVLLQGERIALGSGKQILGRGTGKPARPDTLTLPYPRRLGMVIGKHAAGDVRQYPLSKYGISRAHAWLRLTNDALHVGLELEARGPLVHLNTGMKFVTSAVPGADDGLRIKPGEHLMLGPYVMRFVFT